MIGKILFFVCSPLDQRDVDRFGFEVLKQNGFEVEVWDFTAIVSPERFASYSPPDKSDFSRCSLFHNREEAARAIAELSEDTFVVCLLSYGFASHFAFRGLAKRNIPYALYSWSHAWSHVKKKGPLFRALDVNWYKLSTFFFNAAPAKVLGVSPADAVLVLAGELSVPAFAVSPRTKILWSHNFDYERFLQVRAAAGEQDPDMGVFLDQAFPFHPDAAGKPLFSPEEYYPRLREFFDNLEKRHGVRIVVAAHPRFASEAKGNWFGNREIVRGRTAELVAEAGFVILHDSASINYGVLFRRPLVFITTDRLQESRRELSEFMAGLFAKRPFNIDRSLDVDLESELVVNERLYDQFIDRYIKKIGTDDRAAWQLFADYVKSSFPAESSDRVV